MRTVHCGRKSHLVCVLSGLRPYKVFYEAPRYRNALSLSASCSYTCFLAFLSMATNASAMLHNFFSFPNHRAPRLSFLPCHASLAYTRKISAESSSVALNSGRSFYRLSGFQKPVPPITNSRFLQMVTHETGSAREIMMKSSGAERGSTSTISQNVGSRFSHLLNSYPNVCNL